MKFTILKNTHQSLPIKLSIDTVDADWLISFNKNCAYRLPGEDQKDWNKLIGFTFGLLPVFKKGKLIRPAHWNSMRFGWRYSTVTGFIEITPYYYINGVRHYAEVDKTGVCSIKIDKEYVFSIKEFGGEIFLKVRSKDHVMVGQWKIKFPPNLLFIGWRLNPFFGGNLKAPHELCINISSY